MSDRRGRGIDVARSFAGLSQSGLGSQESRVVDLRKGVHGYPLGGDSMVILSSAS
jgi:hypothetical protein